MTFWIVIHDLDFAPIGRSDRKTALSRGAGESPAGRFQVEARLFGFESPDFLGVARTVFADDGTKGPELEPANEKFAVFGVEGIAAEEAEEAAEAAEAAEGVARGGAEGEVAEDAVVGDVGVCAGFVEVGAPVEGDDLDGAGVGVDAGYNFI